MSAEANITRHEMRSAPTFRCDFCGGEYRAFTGESIGSAFTRDACPDCAKRLSRCSRCKGVGICPDMPGTGRYGEPSDYCSKCEGEGLDPRAGCQMTGSARCDDLSCVRCNQRDAAEAHDRGVDAGRGK